MAAKLVYLKLELKRALKRLPHMAAGAIVLMAMLGTIAFAASKLLYGETTLERVTIGVVLPEEDRIARQLVRMLGTYDSVRSVCEFSFMDSSEAEKQLRDGEIFGIMNVPEGLVQGIINGTNIPVTITLPQGNALENRVFKELTSAGARTLGSAQAGIYAGDQLLLNYDLAGGISQLEADLNRIYMAYSLPRADLFEHVKVSATGDVDTLEFYGISAFVLYLLLAAIPVSGYLTPESRVMSQKLSLAGIGPWMATAARLAGLGYGPEILTVRLQNFAEIDQVAAEAGKFDFVLADLGVSSMQIDNPERGFTFKAEGPLDLRMNPERGVSAAQRLKEITLEELTGMLTENADEPYAEEIAREVTGRLKRGEEIATTTKLYQVIGDALAFLPEKDRKEAVKKSSQRTFQALRIDVNNEYEALYAFLEKLPGVLAPGGRAAILTFHSGEDRLVKKSFKQFKKEGYYSEICEEVIRPSQEECARNSRARSTKMRWAVRAE